MAFFGIVAAAGLELLQRANHLDWPRVTQQRLQSSQTNLFKFSCGGLLAVLSEQS